MAENNEELMMKASLLERHSQELAEKIEYLSQQILDFGEFLKNLDSISDSKEKKMFASLGKGVYVRSSLEEKNLFVNVGSGVVVKKTPKETKEIIESQIKQFHEAKSRLNAQMEVYNGMLSNLMSELSK